MAAVRTTLAESDRGTMDRVCVALSYARSAPRNPGEDREYANPRNDWSGACGESPVAQSELRAGFGFKGALVSRVIH